MFCHVESFVMEFIFRQTKFLKLYSSQWIWIILVLIVIWREIIASQLQMLMVGGDRDKGQKDKKNLIGLKFWFQYKSLMKHKYCLAASIF